jgi:hypothetical protein
MIRKFQLLFLIAFFFLAGILFAQKKDFEFPVLKGPYLGQKPPGMAPELFAPQLFEAEHGYHTPVVFSPDLTEAVWSPMEIEGVRGEQDIYLARFDGEKYLEPMDLGEAINSDGKDLTPFIAPDESYLIFTRIGKGTRKTDLYISFKNSDGGWTKAVDMEAGINTEHHDLCASVTPDAKYLFFLSQREGKYRIYWVDTGIIENLNRIT